MDGDRAGNLLQGFGWWEFGYHFSVMAAHFSVITLTHFSVMAALGLYCNNI